jgi:hypothetical protein
LEPFPDRRRTFPWIRSTLPDKGKLLPYIRQIFPNDRKSPPDIRPAVPISLKPIRNIRQAFPYIRNWIPDIRNPIPDIRKCMANISEPSLYVRKWPEFQCRTGNGARGSAHDAWLWRKFGITFSFLKPCRAHRRKATTIRGKLEVMSWLILAG